MNDVGQLAIRIKSANEMQFIVRADPVDQSQAGQRLCC